ncbi:hypothetical protein AZE42_07921 [Rhizopogon vesiculosus]|uniref:Uncharacterized protein n=1 Tax=Rhizopogon vesiculosus TaxID=180088 RepID=A0A1J8QQY5_9AGAM|nr:hypothetical protein AZE42_07921 [Rhizopogon vesiculosus]
MFLSDKRHTPTMLQVKKEKKPDPPPQVYDIDLMNAEQEDDPLDVPRTYQVKQLFHCYTGYCLVFVGQPQPGAGPSRVLDRKEHAEAVFLAQFHLLNNYL